MATNREIFDKIAGSWYGFRHHTRFRDDLDELAVRWKRGKLLNLGCGHGPDFIPFGGGFELYGMDFSSQMLRQAVKYAIKYEFSAHLAVADLLHLPSKNGSFDWAIAVATYHHIRSTDDRQNAFRELHRVVKAGSEVFKIGRAHV